MTEFAELDPSQLEQLSREQLLRHALGLQSQLAGLRDQLEVQKITDSLTGLANRDYFFASLARLCWRARRFGQMACMTLVDIDDFGVVNEQHGTLAGDLVLTGLADLLRSIVRDYDLLARIGEDEFAIAIDHADSQTAQGLSRRIRDAIAGNPFCANERRIPISVTIGAVTARADLLPERPDPLVRLAVEAIETAHRKGRGQCHFMEMSKDQAPGPVEGPAPLPRT